jgi:hypothetical protein
MMSQSDTPVEELPADLAERWERLARAHTAGSQPWPGVDQAVRRSHRRRAGIGAISAAGVLVAGVALTGPFNPLSAVSPAEPTAVAPATGGTPAISREPQTPAEAGLTGPAGGSLGGDRAWITALQKHWMAQNRRTIASPDDVLVLWAGDLDGVRYAVIEFKTILGRQAYPTDWQSATLHGHLGADADAMTLANWGVNLSLQGEGAPTAGTGLGGPDLNLMSVSSRLAIHPAVAFMIAPKATQVDVGTASHLNPDGGGTIHWRRLRKQGAVWVGQLSAIELKVRTFQITGSDGIVVYGTAGPEPESTSGH